MYLIDNYHGNLMSEQPKGNKPEPPKITIVTIKTPAGEKKIPLPEAAGSLLEEYNIEFLLSQKLGESIITIQTAKQRSETKAQSTLLELLTLSNQTSMQLGEIKARNEMEQESKKLEGKGEIEIKSESEDENQDKPQKEPKASSTKKPTKKKPKKVDKS